MTTKSRKQESVDRRDARNIKDDPKPKPTSSKKNTKRWCKGKKGQEHTPECMSYYNAKGIPMDYLESSMFSAVGWRILVCRRCGKELDYFYPMTMFGISKPIPDWVTF